MKNTMKGLVWICACCGRESKTRWGFGDEACAFNAVKCIAWTVRYNDQGRVKFAVAI